MSRPQLFCIVLCNRASLCELSLLASRTQQDSRRTRGLKPACFMGAFSANQRKPGNADKFLIVSRVGNPRNRVVEAVIDPRYAQELSSSHRSDRRRPGS
jgi:hypothetical protein